MAVTIEGEIVNTCDSTTGFTGGSGFGTDDAAWEGTAAYGTKASATTVEFWTTADDGGGAGFPYDFSSGGAEHGYHMIIWTNTKTPVNTAAGTGITMIMGNDGTNYGKWNVIDNGATYTGGWQSRVIDTAADFDTANGTYTTTGNPAQLSAVATMGGGFTTITSIMGSFNNVQIDMFSIGLGLRVDGGSSGTPNTFETVRAADEDGTLWGWWSGLSGGFLGKGKLIIGPVNGSTASTFSDTNATVTFAQERVAADFYEIQITGSATTCSLELMNISSASGSTKWGIGVDEFVHSFTATNCVFSVGGLFDLSPSTSFDSNTLIDVDQLNQSSSTIDNCTVLEANTTAGVPFIYSNNPQSIQDCTFNYSDGHAIEITEPGTYTFSGNTFNNYLGDDTSGSAIFNNSGGSVTMSIVDAASPTVRDGAGSSTLVSADVAVTLTGMKDNTEVRVFDASTSNPQVELAGIENATDGTTDDRSFTFSLGAGTNVDIVIVNLTYEIERIDDYEIPSSAATLPIQQRFDRNYSND